MDRGKHIIWCALSSLINTFHGELQIGAGHLTPVLWQGNALTADSV